MVLESALGALEAIQNAILIAFITVFDSVFGLNWAEGNSAAWVAIAAMVLVLLFL